MLELRPELQVRGPIVPGDPCRHRWIAIGGSCLVLVGAVGASACGAPSSQTAGIVDAGGDGAENDATAQDAATAMDGQSPDAEDGFDDAAPDTANGHDAADGGTARDASNAADGSDGDATGDAGAAATPDSGDAARSDASEGGVTLIAVTTGAAHTCAVTSEGGLRCWGDGVIGQLGNGATVSTNSPVAVVGQSSGVTFVAGGDSHTCAMTSLGVECWGDNSYGQLGDNSDTQRLTPVVMRFPIGVSATAITVGGAHTCALTNDVAAGDGGVMCWGDDTYGDLGTVSMGSVDEPSAVSGLSSGVTAIAAGEAHTCALTVAGGVMCWGDGALGDLGDGSTAQKDAPVPVAGLSSGVVALALGDEFSCAMTTVGGVECWGDNADGELGNDSTAASSVPVAVTALSSGVAAIAAGHNHACALSTTGGVTCWGGNDRGQLGNGTTTPSLTPVAVTGLSSNVTAIAAAHAEHTCALTMTGAALCWGEGIYGQLGNGASVDSHLPVGVVEP